MAVADNTANSGHSLDSAPFWWVDPGATDWMAWFAIGFIALAVYLIMYLYAAFDRWAEHRASNTPLAKTIPTMLTIALLYEIFPLDHFHALLPLTAILIAITADWMYATNWNKRRAAEETVQAETTGDEPVDLNSESETAGA